MNRILAVHGSPRGERSHSRRLTEGFIEACLAARPRAVLTRREVGRASIPHVGEPFVAAAFYPQPESRPPFMQADLALSDVLVDELLAHDLLVISAPMYNFSIPSGLKAWLDQIVRLGRTFAVNQDNGVAHYEPLVRGKQAVIITSRGGHGFGPGGPNAALNHADSLLCTALGFIGIEDVRVVAAEGEESDRQVFQASCAAAERELVKLAANV
ncbi:FMN-dependent NADH-azoreductase [Pseudomonas benzenivorans]|uniref:FMN dependent NADH:quinone oxidoreductase n=1 Tax=Pseudomonas benzenivorans TaxID=556533 RepID=A0ABY5H4Y8_9PSED|nr:NAD(P)H-dependent oxidoreductase [Pseudomonas benzenivorans]UTW07079.1 NAD(P)H-dependent oxidoreductase [Pseudomonas benzenivorans]